MAAIVKGFGCRPVVACRCLGGPASESLRGRNPRAAIEASAAYGDLIGRRLQRGLPDRPLARRKQTFGLRRLDGSVAPIPAVATLKVNHSSRATTGMPVGVGERIASGLG
jgi:hypothetical protein